MCVDGEAERINNVDENRANKHIMLITLDFKSTPTHSPATQCLCVCVCVCVTVCEYICGSQCMCLFIHYSLKLSAQQQTLLLWCTLFVHAL